jgi:hypothetical protein
MAHFLPSGYNFYELCECRGTKVDWKQVTSQGTQSFIAGTGAVAVQAITDLSREQELIAKSVTNK